MKRQTEKERKKTTERNKSMKRQTEKERKKTTERKKERT